jgi:hypothetical protein
MEKIDLVTIQTFTDVLEATIARGKLEASGIPCHLANENIVTMYPVLSQAVGGYQLQVPTNRIAEAREILGTPVPMDHPETAAPLVCPSCKSPDVERKNYGRLLVILAMLLFFVPMRLESKWWRCRACGRRFK